MKIVFCIPGSSMSGNFFRCWSELLKELPSMEIEWELINKYSPIVYQARLRCVNEAIDKDYDYMMWIDSDIIFEPNDFEVLLDSIKKYKSQINYYKYKFNKHSFNEILRLIKNKL